MLEIKNLKASVEDKEILKGIDLSVKAGEVHAIMGPNGSGKSTLASVLAGNEKFTVTAGEVEFLGRNLLEMPAVLILLLAGVAAVLTGLIKGIFTDSRKGIWFAGAGTVATVLALLLTAGWNGTAYYPSLTDPQSSLTIRNSSSSLFTLQVMSWVSLLIPFVVAYIWYAWRSLARKEPAEGAAAEKEGY